MALFALASSLAPFAAVVMLGLTSRRANSGVALATLVCGVGGGIVLSLLLGSDPRQRMHPMWSVTLAFAGTFVMGQMLAMIFGESRRRGSMRGLVLGAAPIGAISEEHDADIHVPDSGESSDRRK
jgi:Na+/proline symporter